MECALYVAPGRHEPNCTVLFYQGWNALACATLSLVGLCSLKLHLVSLKLVFSQHSSFFFIWLAYLFIFLYLFFCLLFECETPSNIFVLCRFCVSYPTTLAVLLCEVLTCSGVASQRIASSCLPSYQSFELSRFGSSKSDALRDSWFSFSIYMHGVVL